MLIAPDGTIFSLAQTLTPVHCWIDPVRNILFQT